MESFMAFIADSLIAFMILTFIVMPFITAFWRQLLEGVATFAFIATLFYFIPFTHDKYFGPHSFFAGLLITNEIPPMQVR